ncbi:MULTISPECIES: hypothetical protein [unclassified Streptomyces]|uniref:hypothetical protein n=1 Tax=unclassified Streptomyces TaxID=2593676 RepID=UPI0038047CB2
MAMSVSVAAPSACASSEMAASDVGGFITDGDHVHVSSTPPATASAHGWWPLLPVATVLNDVLRHMGTYMLTGLHTVAPLQLSPDDGSGYLSQAVDWVAAAGPGPSADCAITIAAREFAGLSNRAHDVNVLILERFFGRLDIHPGKPAAPGGGLAPSLVGEVQTEGMRHAASIHCSLPAWSLETATWATEVTATAVRGAGVTEPVLLTISRNGDHLQPNV